MILGLTTRFHLHDVQQAVVKRLLATASTPAELAMERLILGLKYRGVLPISYINDQFVQVCRLPAGPSVQELHLINDMETVKRIMDGREMAARDASMSIEPLVREPQQIRKRLQRIA